MCGRLSENVKHLTTLIPILGDQLSFSLASLQDADPATSLLLMMEVGDETTYVRHHRRKLAYILSAMRHHAVALEEAGWRVDYVKLDDSDNGGSFNGEIARAVARHRAERIVVTEAGEWRVQAMLEAWQTLFGIPVEIRTDTRFIASHAEFEAFAAARKDLVMEFFYREQRRKTGLLMHGTRPEGGRWNFDKENRKPAKTDLFMPAQPRFPAGRDHAGGDRDGGARLSRFTRRSGQVGSGRHSRGCIGRASRVSRWRVAELRRLPGRDADRRDAHVARASVTLHQLRLARSAGFVPSGRAALS
jgi:hypothetical protein